MSNKYKREPNERTARSIVATDIQMSRLRELGLELLGYNKYSVSAIVTHIADVGEVKEIDGKLYLVVPAAEVLELEEAA